MSKEIEAEPEETQRTIAAILVALKRSVARERAHDVRLKDGVYRRVMPYSVLHWLRDRSQKN